MRAFFAGLRNLRGALSVFATVLVASIGVSAVFAASESDTGNSGLLFALSAGNGLAADFAKGDPVLAVALRVLRTGAAVDKRCRRREIAVLAVPR